MNNWLLLLRSKISQHYNLSAVLLIIGLCLGIYHRVGQLGFVFDDSRAIVDNSFVHKGVEGIPHLLKTTLWKGDTTMNYAIEAYRPLTMISFALDYELFGLEPAGFHWTQLIFYTLLCVFSYHTLILLLGQQRRYIALLSSIIFTIHPIHTEVVCNLKSRDELLSLFFAICALYNVARHIKTGNVKYKYFAAIFYPLGLFSKETAVVFLGIIPLTYYFFSSLRVADILKNTIPFLVGFAIFMLVRHLVLANESLPWTPITHAQNPLLLIETWSKKWGTILYINGKYLQLMLFPYQLTFSYFYDDIPFVEIWHWKAILTVMGYLTIGYYIFKNFKSKDVGAYGLLCYLAGLSIFSHVIIPFVNAMGERLAFTMSWGWCLFLGAFVVKLFTVKSSVFLRKIITSIATAALLIFFIHKSYARVPAWKDIITLCSIDEKVSPNSVFLNRFLLAAAYEKAIIKRDPISIATAEKYANNMTKLDSLDPFYWIKKGHLFLLKGDLEQAEHALENGLRFASYYFNESFNEFKTDHIELSWNNYTLKRVKIYYPSLGYVYKHIGEVFFDVRNYRRAISLFEAAMPHMTSEIGKFYINRDLGISHLMIKKYDKAVEYFAKADSIRAGDYYVQNGLGNCYFRMKDYKRANEAFEKAFSKYKTAELLQNLIATNQLLGDSAKVAYYKGLIQNRNE
ncbi:MAG: hypothetical protein RMJ87_06835 [Cytophagales bacterium]|nr:hypothetical protein [Cytophagales bacterium]